jgi:hypothetical protein
MGHWFALPSSKERLHEPVACLQSAVAPGAVAAGGLANLAFLRNFLSISGAIGGL